MKIHLFSFAISSCCSRNNVCCCSFNALFLFVTLAAMTSCWSCNILTLSFCFFKCSINANYFSASMTIKSIACSYFTATASPLAVTLCFSQYSLSVASVSTGMCMATQPWLSSSTYYCKVSFTVCMSPTVSLSYCSSSSND